MVTEGYRIDGIKTGQLLCMSIVACVISLAGEDVVAQPMARFNGVNG